MNLLSPLADNHVVTELVRLFGDEGDKESWRLLSLLFPGFWLSRWKSDESLWWTSVSFLFAEQVDGWIGHVSSSRLIYKMLKINETKFTFLRHIKKMLLNKTGYDRYRVSGTKMFISAQEESKNQILSILNGNAHSVGQRPSVLRALPCIG